MIVPAGAAVRITFSIGPMETGSLVKGAKPAKSLLESQSDVRLTVIMGCTFCGEHGSFLRQTVYHPASMRSEPIQFSVTTNPPPENVLSYRGRLEFTIFNEETGVEYDHLRTLVTVSSGLPTWISPKAQQSLVTQLVAVDATQELPDVRIYVNKDIASKLSISMDAYEPGLRTRLEGRIRNPDKTKKIFTPNFKDQNDVVRKISGYNGQLTQIGLPDSDYSKLLKPQAGGPGLSDEAIGNLVFSESDERFVRDIFSNFGNTLYRELFVSGDASGELAAIIAAIEATSIPGRRVRLEISTDAASMPWQLIYPLGDAPPDAFWGLKFDLAVKRTDVARVSSRPGPLGRTMVFARYGVDDDHSVKWAEMQIKALQDAKGVQLTVIKSKQEFTKTKVPQLRQSMSAFITYLHAEAGFLRQTADGQAIDLATAAGPLLRFGEEGEFIASVDFDGLQNSQSVDELVKHTPYFPKNPIVILNACETGGGVTQINKISLQEKFFDLGARGIVVTETPVWDNLAYEVGTSLIDRLLRGEGMASALTETRIELYKKKNLLGLLYAYYGEPTARFESAP